MSKNRSSFFSTQFLFVLDHKTLDILDVNDPAVDFYGFSREEFFQMNIRDLGEKKDRSMLIPTGKEDPATGKIWVQKKKSGETVYVQFTAHTFNYKGRVAKLATAHNVTSQVQNQVKDTNEYPHIQLYRGNKQLAEIIWDADQQVQKWSDKAEELFGWSKDEVIGHPNFFERFIYENELEEAYNLVAEKVDAQERSFTVNGRVRTKKGEIRICEWHNTLIYDQTGNLVSVYSLVQDISDRKESEYLFKALSEESLVGVYLIQDGIFKYINPRLAEIFNYTKEEIEQKLGPLDLTHPEDREEVAENIRKRVDGEEESIQYDFRCLTKDNETIHIKVFGSRIDYLGKPAIVGTLLDITHSKLAFERYQASVESFEDLFDSISDAIYIQDKEGHFLKVNDAAVKLNGYDRDFLIGNTPDVLAAPGKVDLEETHAYFEKALNGTPQKFEQWGQRKNGEVFPEEVILNPGTYLGEDVVIAISRDISDRYEIEDKIQATEERLRQLFKNAPFGIVMMDKHQDIKRINPAFEDIFGYNADEIEGVDIDRLIVPENNYEKGRKISQDVFEGKVTSATAKRKRKDGSLIDVLIYGVPVILNNRSIGIFGIYVDISDRMKAEEKIKTSLKEKEVLLAEIHHRVKNNLAVITGLLELQQYNTDSEEARDILRESQLRINSIALIHEKLYQNENLSQISIDVYLKELIDIIVSSVSTEETEVSISVDSDSIYLTINQAIPCGLILNELITNAYKHAFKGRETGEIEISLKKEGETFFLVFADNGRGMPDNLDFDNPKTLGLTLIQTLARQLQGTCAFESLEEGMCFTLQFELDE